MAHTITIRLNDAGQRAAILAGQPAQVEQRYDVPAELLPRLLALPWTTIDAAGTATAVVPPNTWWGEYERKQPVGTPFDSHSFGRGVTLDLCASVRPETVEAAIAFAEGRIRAGLSQLDEERRAWAEKQADE